MKQVEWNDAFKVGNDLMDAHHQIFFMMVKEFSEVPQSDHDALAKRIAFLVDYAAMHLGAEEDLMRRAGYPEFDRHKAIHDAFVRQVCSIEKKFDENPGNVTGEDVLSLVSAWLTHHIMDETNITNPM